MTIGPRGPQLFICQIMGYPPDFFGESTRIACTRLRSSRVGREGRSLALYAWDSRQFDQKVQGMRKLFWGRGAGVAAILIAAFSAAPAKAQSCGCSTAYRVVCKTIYEQQPVTAYRIEYETVLEQRQVTVQRPVMETQMQERRYTVARPVTETSTREQRYTVRRPVYETSYRDQSSSDPTDQVFDGSPDELHYGVDVDNELYGFQLGADTEFFLTRRVSLRTTTKFGVYNNHMEQEQRVGGAQGSAWVNDPISPNNGLAYNVSSDDDDIAFLGELDAGANFYLTNNLRLTGGYRVVGATGIARAKDQIPYNFDDIVGARDINSDGTMILHGAYGGVEFNY